MDSCNRMSSSDPSVPFRANEIGERNPISFEAFGVVDNPFRSSPSWKQLPPGDEPDRHGSYDCKDSDMDLKSDVTIRKRCNANILEVESSQQNEKSEPFAPVTNELKSNFSWRKSTAIAVSVLFILVCVNYGLTLAFGKDDQLTSSVWGKYKFAAVATDSQLCSDIGRDMMARYGGNAVDATVAAGLCVGLVHTHSTGLGGGGLWTIYIKNHGWFSLNSRISAPGFASETMYSEPENNNKSLRGSMSVAVPGLLKGMWEVHRRFGRLPWKSLVQPIIALCQNGVPLFRPTFRAIEIYKDQLMRIDNLREFYFDGDEIKPQGTLLYMPELAKTFQIIADDPMSFYNGSLAETIISEIREHGGKVELNDLKKYEAKWIEPSKFTFSNRFTIYSSPPPGAGHILSYCLNILQGYNMTEDSIATVDGKILTYHRIIEALKFAHARRMDLGDPDFVDNEEVFNLLLSKAYGEATRAKITDHETHDIHYYEAKALDKDHHGTTHLSVIDGEGNAVSYSNSMNTYFGALMKGKHTGILYNNAMDDFSKPGVENHFGLPPSEANFIRPFKRPMSSMNPSIIFDESTQSVRMVTGAAGGSKITSGVLLNIISVLWFNISLPDAVDLPRLHHQFIPNTLDLNGFMEENIKQGLRDKGHIFEKSLGFNVIQAIHVQNDSIIAVSDRRKQGQPSGF